LYGCEIWPLTLEVVLRLRLSETRVLRRIFGPTRNLLTGEWKRNYKMRSLMICTPHQILFS